MVSAKIEYGDVSTAFRLLCSDDKPIFDSAEVFEKLTERHPLAAGDMQRLEDPALTTALQVSDKEVSKAILSFPAGSSGGLDDLRPKHLIDLINCKTSGQDLLSAITALTNMLLDGKCHPAVRPILFGRNLTAQAKKSGGFRPIAVRYTWRRIAAKCANAFAMNTLGDYFAPTQLGVGVSSGCEAAVHATRRVIETMPADYVVAKLDFLNAFTTYARMLCYSKISIKCQRYISFAACHTNNHRFCVTVPGQSHLRRARNEMILSDVFCFALCFSQFYLR